MFSILKLFYLIWRAGWGIINPNLNPMRGAPPHIKYFATIILGCLWSLAFGLYTAQFFFIGLNMLAHIAVISMVFVTWYTFRRFKTTYGSSSYPLMRDPNFQPKCYEMTDAEIKKSLSNADQLLEKQSTNSKLTGSANMDGNSSKG